MTFFTSVALTQPLWKKGLTIVGTLRQSKSDIPPLMKASMFKLCCKSIWIRWQPYHGQLLYVRQNGQAVMFLSTTHHNKVGDENSWHLHLQTLNTEVAMVLWYNLLDITTLNAFTFFAAQLQTLFIEVMGRCGVTKKIHNPATGKK